MFRPAEFMHFQADAGNGRINLLGHYSFAVPAAAAGGELRPLRTASEP